MKVYAVLIHMFLNNNINHLEKISQASSIFNYMDNFIQSK